MKWFTIFVSILCITSIFSSDNYEFIQYRNGLDAWQIIGAPPEDDRSVTEYTLQPEDIVIEDVSPLKWAYGCSATAAAMIAGYYDRMQYREMYSTANNEFPVSDKNDDVWTTSQHFDCPLSVTKNGIDGRTTDGHVDHFYVATDHSGDDPNPNAAPNSYEDCTGDFMGTSQDYWSNSDGGTTFYYNTNGSKLYDFSACENAELYDPIRRDGAHGLRLFFESRGYNIEQITGNNQIYTQYIYGYNGNTQGFTFENYTQEIDAGRPVLIQVAGHTMCGVGYNDQDGNEEVILYNTWHLFYDTMTWGASYEGMAHVGVTVVNLDEVPTINESESVTGVLSHRANFSFNISSAGNTSISSQGYYLSTSLNSETTGTQYFTTNSTGSYNETITGLTSNTTYYVRAFSQNDSGKMLGLEKTFTTSASEPTETETESITNGNIEVPIEFTETPVSLTFTSVQNADNNNDLTVDEVNTTPVNQGTDLQNENNVSDCSIVITNNTDFTFTDAEVRFNISDLNTLDSNFINENDFLSMDNDELTTVKLWKRENYQSGDFQSVGFLKYHDSDGVNGNADDYLYSNVSSFSEFTFSTSSEETLPVELSQFSCSFISGDDVSIQWTTESETNHYGFNVYKNENLSIENSILLNPSVIAGSNHLGQSYEVIDSDFANQAYYWLESIDLDGTNTFYGPIHIMKSTAAISFASNQVSINYPNIQINWNTNSEDLTVSHFNLYRADDGNYENSTQVNESIIYCSNYSSGSSYNFIDQSIEVGKTYTYWIEANTWDSPIQLMQTEMVYVPYYLLRENTRQVGNNIEINLNFEYLSGMNEIEFWMRSSDNDFQKLCTEDVKEDLSSFDLNKSFFIDHNANNVQFKYVIKSEDKYFEEFGQRINLHRQNKLSSIFPNPMQQNMRSKSISIRYEIFNNDPVDLTIYNIKGQKIRKIVENFSTNGQHQTNWDLMNSKNEEVSNGIYFVKMSSSKSTQIKKFTIIK
jgi:hypothetical protein